MTIIISLNVNSKRCQKCQKEFETMHTTGRDLKLEETVNVGDPFVFIKYSWKAKIRR